MKTWQFLCGFAVAACAASGSLDDGDPNAPPARGDGGADAADADVIEAGVDAGDADAADARCDPSKPFGTPVAIAEVDTTDQDTVSDVSPDELTLYIASNHGVNGMHLYVATRASAASPFGGRTALFAVGAFDDWSAAITADGLTAIIASDRAGGNDELYVATRASPLASFGAPSPATSVNSPSNEQTPRWTADGKTLYFDSDRNKGHREIYRSAVTGGTFGAPERVVELASGTLEAAPVLSADELTIYFLSTRAPSTDGDIWIATRATKAAAFGNIQRLANVNSAGLDVPAQISPDGCVLYLSSTRNALAAGSYDIFVARRPK
jgi:hypothetical protein